MATITGGCFCGQLRYAIDSAQITPTVCHCAGCRRAAAAPAVAWITVPAGDFRLTQGTPATVRKVGAEAGTCDSGGGTRAFCPACGTHLTFTGDDRAHEIDITTGSLDDPEPFPPADDVFLEKKVAWMKRLSG